jgi:hypothetical protein
VACELGTTDVLSGTVVGLASGAPCPSQKFRAKRKVPTAAALVLSFSYRRQRGATKMIQRIRGSVDGREKSAEEVE